MDKTQTLYKVIYSKSEAPKLVLVEDKIPVPTDNEVLVRHTAIGINFRDYEYYAGILVSSTGSVVPGLEAVGVVEKLGKNVKDFKLGQRVGYCTVLYGAYSQYRTIKSNYLFPIPDNITDEAAASNLVKGMTAHYLMRRTFYVHPDMDILIHSASSAVGQTMIRLAREYKANIIATFGNDKKESIISNLGCKNTINYNKSNWLEEVMKITNGKGVSVVYDFLGQLTVLDSIKCLKNFGLMVIAGQITGKPKPVDAKSLTNRCLFLTAPQLHLYKQDDTELLLSSLEIFALIDKQILPSKPSHTYKFNEIPLALEDIKHRNKSGSKIVKI